MVCAARFFPFVSQALLTPEYSTGHSQPGRLFKSNPTAGVQAGDCALPRYSNSTFKIQLLQPWPLPHFGDVTI
jgi:hypothetical protein